MPKSVQISQSLREWMDVFMHRSMRGWNQFAKSTGLSMPQVSLLMQLHYRGACGVSEISERFEISPAAASQLAEKLVQGGYLERAEDPHVRRVRQLKLSAKGSALVADGIQERYRWMDAVVNNLSAEEKARVNEALSVLTDKAKALDS